MKSPCKDCPVPEPPKCRKNCAILKSFQATLEESMQGTGAVRVRRFGARRGHE